MVASPPYTEIVDQRNFNYNFNFNNFSDSIKFFGDSNNNKTINNYQFALKDFNIALEKINSFKNLETNWDTYGALPITDIVINSSLTFLNKFKIIPDIFPTGRGSIQFEFEKSNGDYLEFEIFTDKINYYLKTNSIDIEEQLNPLNLDSILMTFNGTTE